MTGLEYTDRLIEDVNKTATARMKVLNSMAQIKQLRATGKIDLIAMMSSLDITDVEAHLDILSQFINLSSRIVAHDKGNKIDIMAYLRDITNNRIVIGAVFQNIIDNAQLVDQNTGEPISGLLIQQLDWINEAAS